MSTHNEQTSGELDASGQPRGDRPAGQASQEPLQPTPFEPVSGTAVESAATTILPTSGHAPRWVLPALAGLTAVVLLVVFGLPGWLPDRTPAGPPASADDAGGGTAARTASPAKQEPSAAGTPWSDAQAAKLRKEAQDVLAELLDLQFQLEERGAQLWAPEQFAAAKESASAGDLLYRDREFIAARDQYQLGRDQLQALVKQLPQELAAHLEAAREAIESRTPERVKAELELAATIDPESVELAQLQARAEKLPALLQLLEAATVASAAGELAQANARLQEAVALDPQHQWATAELARVASAYNTQQFNAAMSEGYQALDNARFDAAKVSFNRAGKLQPDAEEARSALQELAAAATAHRLAELKQQGERQEQREQWQEAVGSYQAATKIDGSVVFAQQGLRRSEPRARLEKELLAVIKKPERLADSTIAQASQVLLKQASDVAPQGPKLSAQIRQLEELLQQANKPVSVTLRSDQQTSVTVYKVARLGQFDRRELSLRPGTYTAVGTRNGYRDVRKQFSVSHEQAMSPILIVCTERI